MAENIIYVAKSISGKLLTGAKHQVAFSNPSTLIRSIQYKYGYKKLDIGYKYIIKKVIV